MNDQTPLKIPNMAEESNRVDVQVQYKLENPRHMPISFTESSQPELKLVVPEGT